MDSKTLNKFFNNVLENDLIFGYCGSFTDKLTRMLIEISEQNIESHGNLTKLRKRITFLMAECYQNIVRHGTNPHRSVKIPTKSSAFFSTSRHGIFYITSANYIENEFREDIENKLKRVNDLSQDELKELYREVLQKGELSDKGGAGLGIIEMARKSGSKLEYLFENVNEKLSVFYLQLKVKSELAESEPGKKLDMTIEEMRQMHDILNGENIFIMHKGDFSKESVLPVIQMIENNMKDQFDPQLEKQNLFHISVEILQNISIHGLKRNNLSEGLFMLGKQEGHFVINAINYVEKSNAETFSKYLEDITKLDRDELDKRYKTQLRTGPEDGIGARLGLIDVLRACHSYEHKLVEDSGVYRFSQIIVI